MQGGSEHGYQLASKLVATQVNTAIAQGFDKVTMLELCGTELSTFNGLGLVVDVDIKGFTDKEFKDVINTMGSFTGPYPQCTTYRKALIIASDDKLRSVMLWFDPAVFQNQKMYHLGEKHSSIFKDLGIDGRVSVRELASVDFGS